MAEYAYIERCFWAGSNKFLKVPLRQFTKNLRLNISDEFESKKNIRYFQKKIETNLIYCVDLFCRPFLLRLRAILFGIR